MIMNPQEILILFALFQVKHFFVDFVTQVPFYYLNKGKLFHPGGMLHAGEHGAGTFLILMVTAYFTQLSPRDIILLAFADSAIHYIIDFAKVNINQKYGWTATNSENFWILTGLDQLLHQLTYIGIIFYII